jgi:hypothetical protein
MFKVLISKEKEIEFGTRKTQTTRKKGTWKVGGMKDKENQKERCRPPQLRQYDQYVSPLQHLRPSPHRFLFQAMNTPCEQLASTKKEKKKKENQERRLKRRK